MAADLQKFAKISETSGDFRKIMSVRGLWFKPGLRKSMKLDKFSIEFDFSTLFAKKTCLSVYEGSYHFSINVNKCF